MLRDELIKRNKLIQDVKQAFKQIMSAQDDTNDDFSILKKALIQAVKPPNFLYRYCSLERFAKNKKGSIVEDLIKHNRLNFWLSNVKDMNDYYDFYPKLTNEITKDELEVLKKDNLIQHIFKNNKWDFDGLNSEDFLIKYNQIIYNHIDTLRYTTKLLCFTTNYDNLLMWSHYANSHKGICIQFNMKNYPIDLQGPRLLKVNYNDYKDRLEITTKDFVLDHIKFMIRVEENKYTKEKKWKYEDEWRLIFNFNPEKLSKNSILHVSPEIVKNIFLGRKVNKDDIKLLRDLELFSYFNFYRIVDQSYNDGQKKILKINSDLSEEIQNLNELEI